MWEKREGGLEKVPQESFFREPLSRHDFLLNFSTTITLAFRSGFGEGKTIPLNLDKTRGVFFSGGGEVFFCSGYFGQVVNHYSKTVK